MEFLIPAAHAAEAAPGGGSFLIQIAPLIILGVVFWFLIIRPQMKRTREHRELMAALAKGDEVVTAGGIVGTITKVEDQFVVVKVDNNVQLRVQRQAVSATLPKGTLKALDE